MKPFQFARGIGTGSFRVIGSASTLAATRSPNAENGKQALARVERLSQSFAVLPIVRGAVVRLHAALIRLTSILVHPAFCGGLWKVSGIA